MRFYDAYSKRWGVEPEGLGTSSSYMAVYVLRDAIERAGSLDADAVVAALEKTDIMGVYSRPYASFYEIYSLHVSRFQ